MTAKVISPGSGGVTVSSPESITATLTGVYGEWRDAVITIATDTDLSAEVDLGASFHQLQIRIPAIDAADVGIEVAEESGGTYYTLGNGTALILAGEGGFTTTVLLGGYQYIKVRTTNPQSANRTFRIRGSNV